MSKKVEIMLYRWAGTIGPFQITSECVECDFALAQLRSFLDSHPSWPLELEVKPWLNHAWESLRRGGWHAPVVLVDGRVISQGKVPAWAKLEAAVRQALSRRGIQVQPRPVERATPSPAEAQ